jgi:predicted dehydrogenase
MARYHIRQMLKMQSTTRIVALCEPSEAMVLEAAKVFVEAGVPPPPNQPDWQRLIAEYGAELDAVFIITPHALHHAQTKACLEAGIDVLLEKPMVMTAAEAHSLIETRDRTGRLLVVAFQGSLSPQVRLASRLLRTNEFGRILTISGLVWQDWGPITANTWRQEPALSGGGFLFDTGAHLLNTIADLAGEDFSEVAAWFVHNGRPVETLAVAMGRLNSGGLVTFHACGEAIPSCALRFGCSAKKRFCTQEFGVRIWPYNTLAIRLRIQFLCHRRWVYGSSSWRCAVVVFPIHRRPKLDCGWQNCGMRSGRARPKMECQ